MGAIDQKGRGSVVGRFSGGWSLGLFFLLALGCGSSETLTYPVSGIVTLDGLPMEGAAVMLKPIAGGSNGYGVTGTDGSFEITTYRKGDGALPGEHRVVVTLQKRVEAASQASGPGLSKSEKTSSETNGAGREGFDDGGAERTAGAEEVVFLIPKRYSSFKTSGLTTTVTAENGSLILALTGD